MKIVVKGIFIICTSLKQISIESHSDSKLKLNKQPAVVTVVSARTTFTILLQSCILVSNVLEKESFILKVIQSCALGVYVIRKNNGSYLSLDKENSY